ncbi:MAG TPA: tRNA pseudouridine(38-40) synthase TruA [Firmicutes bacterium]|nr:tRNA pseudouridine(38-40) synthase TruA [Bacillota bacterium]
MPEVTNLKVTIAYDGTDFCGFQRQAQGERTVQGELEKALLKLTDAVPQIIASGRTDSGVHAKGQVINFKTSSRIPLRRWPAAFNSCLPPDLVVWNAEEVAPDFHARYGAKAKTYQYIVSRRRWPDIFLRRYSYHYPVVLEVAAIREAAATLVGLHDFKGFAAAGSSALTTTRHLYQVEIEEQGEELIFMLKGSGFLYKTVRNIVGTLLLIGEGKMAPVMIREILATGKREKAGPTAPPQGLTLLSVQY